MPEEFTIRQLSEVERKLKVLKEHPDFWCTYASVRKALEHVYNNSNDPDRVTQALRMLVMFGDEQ